LQTNNYWSHYTNNIAQSTIWIHFCKTANTRS